MSLDGDAHETRRNAAIAIGVAVAAFAGVGLLYWLFNSLTGPALAVSPTSATTAVSTTSASAAPAPSATTEVAPPTIESWTPTATFSLPPPEAPTMTATVEAPAPAATTQAPPPPAPTTQAPPPPPITQAPPPPAAASISNVNLSCSKEGRRVVAKLSFDTTTKVDVLLSAGGDISTRSAGPGSVSMTNNGRNGDVCLARIGGQVVGPVPAT